MREALVEHGAGGTTPRFALISPAISRVILPPISRVISRVISTKRARWVGPRVTKSLKTMCKA